VSQPLLIVAISVIAAVVVASSVFFLWTLVERLAGRKGAAESADVTDSEEQPEPEEPQQDT
jgi:hypothetical protein